MSRELKEVIMYFVMSWLAELNLKTSLWVSDTNVTSDYNVIKKVILLNVSNSLTLFLHFFVFRVVHKHLQSLF